MTLVKILLIFGGISCLLHNVNSLDFSQFYLPPCCYIAPKEDRYSGYASTVTAKREVLAVNSPSSQLQHPTSDNIIIKDSENRNLSASNLVKRIKLYKLVIPLQNNPQDTPTTEQPESTQVKPPTVGNVSFPENTVPTVGNILFPKNPDISELVKLKRNSPLNSNLEEVITLDHGFFENPWSDVKTLSQSESTKITNTTKIVNPSDNINSSSVQFVPSVTESFWEKIPLIDTNTDNSSSNIPQSDNEILHRAASETQSYASNKMPPTWLTNLRRALYQSLMAEKTNENIQNNAKSNHPSTPNRQTKRFWKQIRHAKLKFVDKLSQSESELPEVIYLPAGQGPIVAGVVVNTIDGIQFRVASELYLPPEPQENIIPSASGETKEDCDCHLIHHGEILLAYWSISRISNENGQPALQYLVYPVPHTVPTPPELIPFSGGDQFRPSPPDPYPNYQADYKNTLQRNQIHQDFILGNHIGNGPVNNPDNKNVEFFHSLPNGHHRLEINHNNPDSYQPPLLPPPTSHEINQDPIHNDFYSRIPKKGYRGAIIETQNGYTPEFIDLYRSAVEEHFRRKDTYDQENIIPHDYPQQYAQHHPGFTIPLNSPIPTQLAHPDVEHVQEKLMITTDIPQQLPPPEIQQHYPKSIQDIIAPLYPPVAPTPESTPMSFPLNLERPPPQQNDINDNEIPYLNPHIVHNHLHSNYPNHVGISEPHLHPPTRTNNHRDYYEKGHGHSYSNYGKLPQNHKFDYTERKPRPHMKSYLSSVNKQNDTPEKLVEPAYILNF